MATLKQSTAYTRMFLLVQTADHITGLTGAAPTVTLSKAGGAFGAAAGSVTEVSSGWYKIALSTVDTGTLGDLAYHVTAGSGDPTDFVDQVSVRLVDDVATQTGVDDLPTNAELATALGTADDAILAAIAALNNLSQANIRTAVGLGSANLDTQLDALPTNAELATALGTADDAVLAAIAALNNLSAAGIRTAVGLGSANLDTQLGDLPTNSELATALGTADDAVLAAIAALNNLSQANIRSAVGLGSANLDTQLGDLPTNAEMATALGTADDAVLSAIAALNNISTAQVNAEVDTALADVGLTGTVTGRIDAAITSRLASGGYTAPDNASVTAIKAKTDSLVFTVGGSVDANIQRVNDVSVAGTGTTLDPWGP